MFLVIQRFLNKEQIRILMWLDYNFSTIHSLAVVSTLHRDVTVLIDLAYDTSQAEGLKKHSLLFLVGHNGYVIKYVCDLYFKIDLSTRTYLQNVHDYMLGEILIITNITE